MKNITVNCGNLEISNNKSFCVIAGPCQLETEQHAMDMAGKIKEITKLILRKVKYVVLDADALTCFKDDLKSVNKRLSSN